MRCCAIATCTSDAAIALRLTAPAYRNPIAAFDARDRTDTMAGLTACGRDGSLRARAVRTSPVRRASLERPDQVALRPTGDLEVARVMVVVSTVRPLVKSVQSGIPAAIPTGTCDLGWQESLSRLAQLVEPEIRDGA